MSVSKNYFYNVMLIISNTIFPIITFPYVSRILMPEYLGKVYFVQGVVAYFLILAVLGVPNYGIRELSRAKSVKDFDEFKKIYTEMLVMSIGSSIMSLILMVIVVNLYGKFAAEKLIFYIFGIQVLFECFQINHYFIVQENHKRRLIRSFVIRILSLGFLFTFIKKPSDYYLYALLLVVPEVIARIIDVYTERKQIWWNWAELNFRRHYKKTLLIFLYIFTIGIYGSIDSTMLGIMVGDTEVGLYTAAVKMNRMVLPVMLSLATVLSPRIIGAIKNKDKDKIYSNMDLFINFAFFMGIPVTALLIILAPELTILFSGARFEGSILTMQIMTPSLIFLAIGTFMGGQVMLPNDKEREILYISLIGVFINIGLNYFMIPSLARNGAALATLITEVVISLVKIGRVKFIYADYKIMTKDRLFSVLSGVLATVAVSFCHYRLDIFSLYGDFMTLIFVGSFFMVVYLLGLLLTKNKFLFEGLSYIKKRS
ncbi:MAG: flippase [Cetobacterium sp.]